MKTETIILIILGVLGATILYAMDWQRDQDEKLNDLDKLIQRQTTVLEMQIEYNERIEERRAFQPTPFSSPTKLNKEID